MIKRYMAGVLGERHWLRRVCWQWQRKPGGSCLEARRSRQGEWGSQASEAGGALPRLPIGRPERIVS